MQSKVQNTVGVAPLVVVPTDNLVEVVVEANACLSINDWAVRVMIEVCADDFIFSVTKNALQNYINILKFIYRI